MKLVHYSRAPVAVARSAAQDDPFHHKPIGLWLSCDDFEPSWRDWCVGESFALENLTHVHDVTLSPKASILRLSSVADLDGFDETFGNGKDARFDICTIRWADVAQQYQGIIIAPFIWERRLSLMWYYCWDCASGCIWDAEAVSSITPRRLPATEVSAQERASA